MTQFLIEDAMMARVVGGTFVPFAPGPVILPHGPQDTMRLAEPDLPSNGPPLAPIFVGPCNNPDANG